MSENLKCTKSSNFVLASNGLSGGVRNASWLTKAALAQMAETFRKKLIGAVRPRASRSQTRRNRIEKPEEKQVRPAYTTKMSDFTATLLCPNDAVSQSHYVIYSQ